MITSRMGKSSTVEQLKRIPLITPEWVGQRWVGIQHGELVETLHTELARRDIVVEDEGWYPEGKYAGRLDGHMRLRIPGLEERDDMSYQLGLQHSNLGDHSLKFAVGAKVFVCSNGMVVGDYAVKRKHTKGVHLPDIISTGIDTFLKRIKEVPETTEKLKARGVAESDVNAMLMTAGREGLVPWSRIGQVDSEYRKPRFSDFKGRNAWSLYNAFTYVVQKSPPHAHLRGMNRFREICMDLDAAQSMGRN